MFDGQLPFWAEHWRRLAKGANYLQFPDLEDPDFYKDEIYRLCGHQGNFRIRLNLFRKGAGLYTPQDLNSDFLVEASSLDSNHFELNRAGLQIDLCKNLCIPRHPLSKYKTLNSLNYVLAGIYKKQHQLDDCLLLNDQRQIVEASSSNLFLIKNQQIITPKLNSGCKDGTMRRVLIPLVKNLGLELSKKKIREQDLLAAEEIWLSNAVQGLRWVGSFQGQAYGQHWAKKAIARLNQLIAASIGAD